jgi:hypothetical protein
LSAAATESTTAAIDHSGRPDAFSHIQVSENGMSTVSPEGA